VGVFFVNQTPKDVPADVLAQLGSRVQHQLRAHTPDDARALKATVSTYPVSGYDLAQVLQSLPTGEAIVTVMNERGAPSPVAWTRLRVPQSSMSPTPPEQRAAAVAASPLLREYGTATRSVSAQQVLAQRHPEPAAAPAAVRTGTPARSAERPERPARTAARARSARTSARRSPSLARRVIEKLFGSTR